MVAFPLGDLSEAGTVCFCVISQIGEQPAAPVQRAVHSRTVLSSG